MLLSSSLINQYIPSPPCFGRQQVLGKCDCVWTPTPLTVWCWAGSTQWVIPSIIKALILWGWQGSDIRWEAELAVHHRAEIQSRKTSTKTFKLHTERPRHLTGLDQEHSYWDMTVPTTSTPRCPLFFFWKQLLAGIRRKMVRPKQK